MSINQITSILDKLDQAPETGILYVSNRNERILLRRYSSLHEVREILDSYRAKDMLEIHAFNKGKEYRWIRTVRSENGLEMIVTDIDGAETYCEEAYVEDWVEGIRKIAVVNYLTYDEFDLIKVSDYRLMEV